MQSMACLPWLKGSVGKWLSFDATVMNTDVDRPIVACGSPVAVYETIMFPSGVIPACHGSGRSCSNVSVDDTRNTTQTIPAKAAKRRTLRTTFAQVLPREKQNEHLIYPEGRVGGQEEGLEKEGQAT